MPAKKPPGPALAKLHKTSPARSATCLKPGSTCQNVGMTNTTNTTKARVARVSIQTEDFNIAMEVGTLRQNDKRVGAVCSFIGTVRDLNDGLAVSSLELEHYPGMTEKAIEAMIDQALARFDIFAARVVHRVGLLQPLDKVVLVAVTSSHRGVSFHACEFLMDYLKTQAPFWKKEVTPEGARWVDARIADDAALHKWDISLHNVR